MRISSKKPSLKTERKSFCFQATILGFLFLFFFDGSYKDELVIVPQSRGWGFNPHPLWPCRSPLEQDIESPQLPPNVASSVANSAKVEKRLTSDSPFHITFRRLFLRHKETNEGRVASDYIFNSICHILRHVLHQRHQETIERQPSGVPANLLRVDQIGRINQNAVRISTDEDLKLRIFNIVNERFAHTHPRCCCLSSKALLVGGLAVNIQRRLEWQMAAISVYSVHLLQAANLSH